MRTSRLLAWAVLAQAAAPATALAEHTRWAQIRDPAIGEEARLRQRTENRLLDYQRDRTSTFAETLMNEGAQLRKARVELEGGHAETHASWRIRALYARVLFSLDLWEGARNMFLSVLLDPDVTEFVRGDLLADLAISEARLGKQAIEVATYDRAIALEPMPAARSTMMANQAEAFMVMGRIDEALEGYRASIETVGIADQRTSFLVSPTTYWSFGVALDRAGDLEGALREIERARAFDPRDKMISGETWFFVPAYDEAYYAALGHLLTARRADDIEQKVASLEYCVIAWKRYLAQAPETDPWVPIARRRLRQAEAEFASAQKTAQTPTPIED